VTPQVPEAPPTSPAWSPRASIREERKRPPIVTVPMGDVRDTTMTVFDELHRLVDALDEGRSRQEAPF